MPRKYITGFESSPRSITLSDDFRQSRYDESRRVPTQDQVDIEKEIERESSISDSSEIETIPENAVKIYGGYISREDFDSIPTDEGKQIVKEQGVDVYNSWIENQNIKMKEAADKSKLEYDNYIQDFNLKNVRSNTGEYIDRDAYNSLSEDEKNVFNTSGYNALVNYQRQQNEIRIKEYIKELAGQPGLNYYEVLKQKDIRGEVDTEFNIPAGGHVDWYLKALGWSQESFHKEAEQVLAPYKMDEGYDIFSAIESGVNPRVLINANFNESDVLAAEKAVEIKRKVAPYTTEEGTDLISAIKAGVSESDLYQAGFTLQQINEARIYANRELLAERAPTQEEYLAEKRISTPSWTDIFAPIVNPFIALYRAGQGNIAEANRIIGGSGSQFVEGLKGIATPAVQAYDVLNPSYEMPWGLEERKAAVSEYYIKYPEIARSFGAGAAQGLTSLGFPAARALYPQVPASEISGSEWAWTGINIALLASPKILPPIVRGIKRVDILPMEFRARLGTAPFSEAPGVQVLERPVFEPIIWETPRIQEIVFPEVPYRGGVFEGPTYNPDVGIAPNYEVLYGGKYFDPAYYLGKTPISKAISYTRVMPRGSPLYAIDVPFAVPYAGLSTGPNTAPGIGISEDYEQITYPVPRTLEETVPVTRERISTVPKISAIQQISVVPYGQVSVKQISAVDVLTKVLTKTDLKTQVKTDVLLETKPYSGVGSLFDISGAGDVMGLRSGDGGKKIALPSIKIGPIESEVARKKKKKRKLKIGMESILLEDELYSGLPTFRTDPLEIIYGKKNIKTRQELGRQKRWTPKVKMITLKD